MGQRLRIRTPDVHAQRSPRIDLRLPHIDVSPRSGRHTGGHSSFTAEANARASGFLARISERPIPFDATAAAHAAVGALGPSQRRSRKRSILMPSRKRTVLGAGLATQVPAGPHRVRSLPLRCARSRRATRLAPRAQVGAEEHEEDFKRELGELFGLLNSRELREQGTGRDLSLATAVSAPQSLKRSHALVA